MITEEDAMLKLCRPELLYSIRALGMAEGSDPLRNN
jgi:hypothetical protein